MPCGIIRDSFKFNIFSINCGGFLSQMYHITFQEGNVENVCGQRSLNIRRLYVKPTSSSSGGVINTTVPGSIEK